MNAGCVGKTVRSLENACHTWAIRQGAIQIHLYLYLYYLYLYYLYLYLYLYYLYLYLYFYQANLQICSILALDPAVMHFAPKMQYNTPLPDKNILQVSSPDPIPFSTRILKWNNITYIHTYVHTHICIFLKMAPEIKVINKQIRSKTHKDPGARTAASEQRNNQCLWVDPRGENPTIVGNCFSIVRKLSSSSSIYIMYMLISWHNAVPVVKSFKLVCNIYQSIA